MYTLDEMKQIRHDYGLSYKDIQEGCEGVSISSIQKAFGGFVDSPRKETLERLSKYFELFMEEKIKDNSEGFPNCVEERNNYQTDGSSALSGTFNFDNEIIRIGGYTYDTYKKLDLPEGTRVEVIDGYIYTMDAPNIWHQKIVSYLVSEFIHHIVKNKGKCSAMASPVDVRIEYDNGDKTVVQPDMIVIFDKDKIDKGESIIGGPDFVLEVISRSSRLKDTGIKLIKYRESGVREYWIADYENERVIKHSFEKDDAVTVYTFDDKVPVDIYDGKLVIDFKEVMEYVRGT